MFHPTAGKGVITSGYLPSHRPDHFGIDLAGLPTGSPIYAWRAGKVEIAVKGCIVGQTTCGLSGGNYVNIRHDNKTVSQYLHLDKNVVSIGQKVKEGQLIGYLGNTGYSLGAHLHFAILVNGQFINPTAYLKSSSTKKKSGNSNTNILPILALLFLDF
jgi:murein DD-endopeptidase MepM/ murein hydrolase activator NlpD